MNFLRDRWKDILSDVIAGLLLLVIPNLISKFTDGERLVTSLQIIAIVIILVSNMVITFFVQKKKQRADFASKESQQKVLFDQMGIVKILPNTVEGEGSTKSILSECENHFFFMGIAANKWIRGADNFDFVMKKILARNGSVRFVVLNPMSKAAQNLSLAGHNPTNHLRTVILGNLKELVQYRNMGLNIQVKAFSHLPVFRIAIVDNERIYLGHYKVNNDGSQLPQLLLQGKNKILFKQFFDYYNITWNSPDLITIDLDKLEDDEYLNTLAINGG